MEPFVFLDKAVLLSDQPFNVDPARIRLAAGWTLALDRLHGAGFSLATISNESGMAFGYYDEHALEVVQRHIASRFATRGFELAGFLYCPHHPVGSVARFTKDCDCHLPKPGLLRRAATELGADLQRSWLIGDSADDMLAARHASCRGLVVDSGSENELFVGRRQTHTYHVAPDLCTAADLIIGELQTEVAA
ncbi:MAG TPA: HAD-IIIA family hydrolase [Gemmatimonadaceae bacterium]|jgi:histidinol-phosphate phosphatase family protein